MRESLSVRFLYHTLPGRLCLKVLVHPKISKWCGKVLDARISKLFIPYFIKKNKIDMTDVLVPKGGFSSFNAFFCRKRKGNPLKAQDDVLYSPCDAYLSYIPIRRTSIFSIKHTAFSLKGLLADETLAAEFEGGTALVFRLTPTHYHRYSYAVSGTVSKQKSISGILHCVRPIVTKQLPVFAQNARKYQLIHTKNFGKVVQMEVGALMVGKITNHKLTRQTRQVVAGQEKGYFEFGGSTIVVLLQKGQVQLRQEVLELGGQEISLRQGDVLGYSIQGSASTKNEK